MKQPPAASRRRRFWHELLTFGKWIAAREELSRDASDPPTQHIDASPLVWLASPDQLPNRTLPRRTRLGFLTWLVSRDNLQNLSQAPRERGFLGWLTIREVLPAASSERPSRSRSIFRWLLIPESHDHLEQLDSTKEVPPHES